MPTTEHIHLPLYTDEETPDLSTTGHYNHAMEILDANVGELEAKDAEIAEDIADEREARIEADSALEAKLSAETKARTDADAALGGRINNTETEISANSYDITGIKGLTYGSEHVLFIENENGSYTSPALEEIAEQVTALETAGWSDIRGKPFSTIGSGLKVVSDTLSVDTSALPSGLTTIAVDETNTAADVYAKAQAAWPNCVLSGDTIYYPYAELPAVGSQDHAYAFTANGVGEASAWIVNATSMTHRSDIIATGNSTWGEIEQH